MISAQCNSCHARYNLKDEFAGKSAKCPNCQAVFQIPNNISNSSLYSSQDNSVFSETYYDSHSTQQEGSEIRQSQPSQSVHASGIFGKSKYGIKQKRIAINEKYYIRDEDNRDIFFALRKIYFWKHLGSVLLAIVITLLIMVFLLGIMSSIGMSEIFLPLFILPIPTFIGIYLYLKPLRHIEFFYSESDMLSGKAEFTITQDKKIELITQNYTLRDNAGLQIACFSKNQFTNIIRRKWHVRYGNKYVLIQEDSIILSLLRRLLPFGYFIRTNFVYYEMKNDTEKGNILGMFKRKIELFDNYTLDLTSDIAYVIPRQIALAIAVLLDTGEKR